MGLAGQVLLLCRRVSWLILGTCGTSGPKGMSILGQVAVDFGGGTGPWFVDSGLDPVDAPGARLTLAPIALTRISPISLAGT